MERRSSLRIYPNSTWAYGTRDIGTTYRKSYIASARGWLLDGLGILYNIQRQENETDENYRARLLQNYDRRKKARNASAN